MFIKPTILDAVQHLRAHDDEAFLTQKIDAAFGFVTAFVGTTTSDEIADAAQLVETRLIELETAEAFVPETSDVEAEAQADRDVDNAREAYKAARAAYFALPPTAIVHEATLQLAAHLYENREAVGFDTDTLPAAIFELIRPFRGWSF